MISVIVGIVLGVLAAFPAVYVLAMSAQKRQYVSFGVILACGIVPFVCLQVILAAVNYGAYDLAVFFGNPDAAEEIAFNLGTSSSLAFLGTIVLGVILVRPWR